MLLRCPMRIGTMAWLIGNEKDWYDAAEEGDFGFLDEFNFPKEEKDEIIQEYLAEHGADEGEEADVDEEDSALAPH